MCHGWQTFSGLRVSQSLVSCVMVGRLLVGFVWLNLQISVSWQVDFQWGSCGSIFSFLCHGRQIFNWVRVSQSSFLCHGRQIFRWVSVAQSSFLCHGWQTFSGVRVAQSLGFCVMVGRLLAGFVWLNLQFSVSWLVDIQWGLCGSIFSFVSWLVDFQWGSCGSIVSFLCHGRQIFSGVRVAQSSFLCHGWQTFSGVRLAQSLGFCVMVGRLLAGLVWLNLQFCVMVGIFLVGFVWLNLQFSVSWLIDFQWVRVAQSLVLCHGWYIFSGVRVAQSLVLCVIVDRLLVGFVWFNLQFSVSWQVEFQWGTCGSIFSFVSWQVDVQWGSCGSIFSFLCHGWQTFSGLRVAQSLDFCVMVGRLLVGFVLLNLLISVSWLEDFQWASCGSIFGFLCHGMQTFSGVRVAQSLVFCVMVCRLLVGFVWLNLQFSVSWLIDLQWGSCGSIFSFVSWLVYFQWGSCGSIFSFLCHG